MRYRISQTHSCGFISFQNTRKFCLNFVGCVIEVRFFMWPLLLLLQLGILSYFLPKFWLWMVWPGCQVVQTRVLLPEGKQRVSPFYHPSIQQLSTLEKTKLCHRPILSSLLSTCFQRLNGGGLARDLCHGQQRVSPFYHISQLAHSEDFDIQKLSSPGFLMQKMTELREPLQSDSSLALTLLWLFLHRSLVFFWHHFRTNCLGMTFHIVGPWRNTKILSFSVLPAEIRDSNMAL